MRNDTDNSNKTQKSWSHMVVSYIGCADTEAQKSVEPQYYHCIGCMRHRNLCQSAGWYIGICYLRRKSCLLSVWIVISSFVCSLCCVLSRSSQEHTHTQWPGWIRSHPILLRFTGKLMVLHITHTHTHTTLTHFNSYKSWHQNCEYFIVWCENARWWCRYESQKNTIIM